RHDEIFDTVTFEDVDADSVIAAAAAAGINVRRVSPTSVGVTVDETTTPDHLDRVAAALGLGALPLASPATRIPADLARSGEILPQAVFRTHHSEHAMLRYLRRLADRD